MVLRDINSAGNALDTMTARSVSRLWLSREIAGYGLERTSVASVRDLTIHARNHLIPIRVYDPAPDRKRHNGEKLPTLIYVHGGGWTLGSIGTYDSLARALANKIPAVVVSVDYRLAPEHPFPAAVDDVHLAVAWIALHSEQVGGDPRRICIAGDSGGATLATVAARKARQEKLPVVFQALFYPSTDISNTDTQSYRDYGEGYLLTKRAVESFRHFYLPNRDDWVDPDASPLLTSIADLKSMPPSLLVTAGCDPLRDEGKAYADRLKGAGVPVEYRLEEDMIHGFLGLLGNRLYPKASTLVERRLDKAVVVIRNCLNAEK